MRGILLIVLGIIATQISFAQIIINEASYKNFTQIANSNGDNPDWIELYNSGNESVNLNQYALSDNATQLNKWKFPSVVLQSHQWLVVFASGVTAIENKVNHWETAVREDLMWRWINPNATTPTSWMRPDFDDSKWAEGKGGFGFADADDNTNFGTQNVAVYTRIRFSIADTSKIYAALLHVDFDDGFVAYLNGTEIARGNISTQVAWNSFADNATEALMINGQNPTAYLLDINEIKELIVPGQNVLAVEGHNASTTSSDMSLRVFLSFGLIDSNSQFEPTPSWFSMETGQILQTNFKISEKGETLYLSNPSDQIIDSLVLPPNMPINYSIGSVTDGSVERGTYMIATPNAPNSAQTPYTQGYESAPVASFSGGYYPENISVALTTSSPTGQIRYTTDGQNPTRNSPLYAVPISVNKTQVLKACCFSTTNKLPSQPVTHTYFIGDEPTPAAILSISIENEHLYGATGIYDNWSTDWKRPCYIEFFDPVKHKPIFKQNSGIKIDGGAGGSRSNPQHSFRVEPGNSTLGDGDVKYPLIPARTNRDSYETFYIRNGSNQYLYYPCKDAIETRSMGEGTNNTYSGYTPLQVYLNGKYWGYYELREKLDEDYFKQHFGTNKDSLEVLSVSYWYGGQLRAVTGNDPIAQYNADYNKFLTLNTSDENFWEQANPLFDMTYYTDYICAQSWICDTDWPYNNIKMYRSPETNHSWRFSLVDLEWSLEPNGWTQSSFDHINFMLNYDQNIPYIHIWQKAMENKRFHDYFINRFADLMNTNWKADRLNVIADEIYTETRPELPNTFLRWGDSNTPVDDYMYQFDAAQTTMIDEFEKRSNNVRNHIVSNFELPKKVSITLKVEPADAGYIQISTVKPDTYPWKGVYFDGVPVKIEAMGKPGFVFEHWDSNALLSDISNAVFNDTLSQNSTFTAHFVDNDISGLVTISEINYNSESSIDAGDWVEFWNFSTTVPTDLSGWYFTDEDTSHIYKFPENTIIGADERLVVVRDNALFEDQYPGIAHLTDLPFGLGNKGDAVKLYDFNNDLIAEVIYADSSPWPLGADGKGRTLELKNPHNSTNSPENWFDGCIGGSPGTNYAPCSESIVFSEINYNSDVDYNTGDWVELRNISNANVDISGWKFMDGVDSVGHSYTVPNGTILLPNTQLVLVQDIDKFAELNTSVTNFVGSFNFGLNNSGEWIRAYDKNGKLKLSVRYNDKLPWPELANGKGYTLELKDSTGIMNNGSTWFAGCYGGSPGIYYTANCRVISAINENLKHEVAVYPNPFKSHLTVDIGKPTEAIIQIFSYTGQLVYTNRINETHTDVDLSSLPRGFYLLNLIYTDGWQKTSKIIKQ